MLPTQCFAHHKDGVTDGKIPLQPNQREIIVVIRDPDTSPDTDLPTRPAPSRLLAGSHEVSGVVNVSPPSNMAASIRARSLRHLRIRGKGDTGEGWGP